MRRFRACPGTFPRRELRTDATQAESPDSARPRTARDPTYGDVRRQARSGASRERHRNGAVFRGYDRRGEEELLESAELRSIIRYFHAWRVRQLRERIGDRLGSAEILDVGDTDGLMLKHLGKTGLGFNLAPAAVKNIESNGVAAKLGDGQQLPFDDASFDYVLCFETLEHVENPHQLLLELARVCRPDGRVFVSIPWVPTTFVRPRTDLARGYGHVFELARDDFAALVTHTPLEVAYHEACDVLGKPRGARQRLFLLANRKRHIVGSTFRRFNFFELAPRA
jgi:SAM-dependent methyltransferase